MISKEYIEKLVAEVVSDEYFVVETTVKSGNFIEISLDGDNGITIDKCIEVSRQVEGNLDREAEDFELNVYSAGLGRSFKVFRQYQKNIGRDVQVDPNEGTPITGVIKSVDENGFVIETKTMERPEKKKKKVEVIRVYNFSFDDVKSVKNVISFK